MDTDVLVEDKIEDGRSLIRELLAHEQIAVDVAFWVKKNEESSWRLWIAVPDVDEALSKVYAALDKIPGCSFSGLDVHLLSNSDPIARSAVALRDRDPNSRELKRYHKTRRLGLSAEELCIYPRIFPWKIRELPEGDWQVLINENDDVWLSCESHEEARMIAAAPVLQYEALDRIKTGEQFAAELERTAAAMQKHRLGFGSRFLRGLAQDVRNREIPNQV